MIKKLKLKKFKIDSLVRVFTSNSYYFVLLYFLCGDLFSKALTSLIRSFVSVPFKLDALMLYGVLALAILCSYRHVLKSFPIKELLLFLLIWICFLISWMVQSGYDDMFAAMAWKFLLGTLGYIYFRRITDWEKTLKWLGGMAFIITISLALYLRTTGGLDRYSLYLGYLVMPGVCISANEMIRRRHVLHGANVLFGFLLLLSMGARGPIACFLLFLIVRVFIETGRSRFGVLIVAILGMVAFFLFRNFDFLVNLLSSFLSAVNLSTRVLKKIQTEQFFNGGTRSRIQFYVKSLISEHLFSGVGIGRDRIYVAQLMDDAFNAIGYYPHNPFLELWVQFGVIIGSVLIIMVLRTAMQGFFNKKNGAETRDVVLIMLFTGFVPLMISSSYFTKPEFFMAMATCRAAIKALPGGTKENKEKYSCVQKTH